jgi:DNA-binding MarR family transcriptional regulator
MEIQSTPQQNDAVDYILKQWEKERPDLDVSPMGPIGRIKRCSILIERLLETGFSSFDLNFWEFDMLATLRRSGSPYRLSPTELFSALMITSGTMTHRLKKLEHRGLIQRVNNSEDARSVLVQLTNTGLELINNALEAHVENERTILSSLSTDELEDLNSHLSVLLKSLEFTTFKTGYFKKNI